MKYVVTYGIACIEEVDGKRELLAEIPGITSSLEAAQRFVAVCNEGKLSPDHLKDVVEDFVVKTGLKKAVSSSRNINLKKAESPFQ